MIKGPIFFDFNKLSKEAKGDITYTYKAFELFCKKKRFAKNINDRNPPINIPGSSFILNPQPLLDSKHDVLWKLQYIQLASLRNYTDYKLFNSRVLDLGLYPEVNISMIKQNPLLKVENNNLIFKFEELYGNLI